MIRRLPAFAGDYERDNRKREECERVQEDVTAVGGASPLLAFSPLTPVAGPAGSLA
jgi:hypothetical protein